MHDRSRWGRVIVATITAGAVLLTPGRQPPPTRAGAAPCATAASGETLLFTSRAAGAAGAAGAADLTLFAADPARPFAPRALVRALPDFAAVAPSPRGRYIALTEGARGLWLVNSDGTDPRRLLPAPPPAPGPTGTYYINAVAWSPDRYTLAYAVTQPIGYPRYPAPPRAAPDGIWLVRYDGRSPRLLASNARLGVDGIGRLSYAADGRTLIAVAGQGRGADNLAVDAATGRATALPGAAGAADDVQASPVAPRLAYLAVVDVPVPGQPNTEDADEGLYVADPDGHRRAELAQTTLATDIRDPVWSPDGRSVAYIWGGSPDQALKEIHAVDVATRRVRTLVRKPPRQEFMSLAWMHCRV